MDPQKYTFILVDDSDIDLLINKRFLELSGLSHEIHAFMEPTQMFGFLKEQHASLHNVVFLIDLQIPDMNGFEMVQEIEKNYPDILPKSKLFILSSSIDLEDKLHASNIAHVAAMLPKPLNTQQLRDSLEPVVAKQPKQ
jgi:CheY-like chemotaxis protein